MALYEQDTKILRLMQYGPIIRRGGSWRFGTRTIGDGVIARLIASGRAASDGQFVQLITCQRPEASK